MRSPVWRSAGLTNVQIVFFPQNSLGYTNESPGIRFNMQLIPSLFGLYFFHSKSINMLKDIHAQKKLILHKDHLQGSGNSC